MEKMSVANEKEFVTETRLEKAFDSFREKMNEDIKMHMGVLYEKFSGDVQLLAEQVSSIDQNVKELKVDLGYVKNKVDVLEVRFDALEGKVNNLETRFDTLEHKVDVLDQKVDKIDHKLDVTFEAVGEIQVDVTEIKDKLDQKADRTELPQHKSYS